MATLANKSIKATLPAVVKYNNNPDKNLPPDGLVAAAAYIRGEHSIERLYSRGHNGCSGNPDVAIEQFKMSETLYREKKGGAKESGMGRYEMDPNKYSKKFNIPLDEVSLNENGKVWVEKTPTIAEHLFLSFPPEENVSYELQCEIADKLCSCDLLKDFYALSNRHYNTDNDHSHILVSNFSKDGSKKLSLNKSKRAELQKELNRVCVSYGLSIIDTPGLRYKDPEYEEFVRSCVGKVKVYAPADYKRQYTDAFGNWMNIQIEKGNVLVAEGKHRDNDPAEAYKKWIAEHEEFVRVKNKKASKKKKAVFISEEQAKSKAAREYYWDTRYRRDNYYYAVRRYDDFGYHKPLLVLFIELLYIVASNESVYFAEKYPNAQKNEVSFGKPDKELQAMYDCIRYQSEQGIRTFAELDSRTQQVGTELSEVRQGQRYYKNAVERGDELYRAIRVFNTMERKEKLTAEEEMVFAEAKRIMAAHNCTEPFQIGEFMRKRQFAEKKVKDLTEQETRLKKDYHDLKFIDSHSEHLAESIEYYVYRSQQTHSLDDLIGRATSAQKSAEARSARGFGYDR